MSNGKPKVSLTANVDAYRAGLKRARESTVPRDGFIDIEDAQGNRTTITRAHWNRWRTELEKSFRPVAEKKDTTVSTEPPTGDKTEEN